MALQSTASTLSTKTVIAPQSVPKTLTGCDLVNNYDWDTATARAVCLAESNGNVNSYNVNTNGTVDKGLMQINSCHADLIGDKDLYDPKVNMDIAYQIYRGSGWRAWSAYNNGSYIAKL